MKNISPTEIIFIHEHFFFFISDLKMSQKFLCSIAFEIVWIKNLCGELNKFCILCFLNKWIFSCLINAEVAFLIRSMDKSTLSIKLIWIGLWCGIITKPRMLKIPKHSKSRNLIISKHSKSRTLKIPKHSKSRTLKIPNDSKSRTLKIPKAQNPEWLKIPNASKSRNTKFFFKILIREFLQIFFEWLFYFLSTKNQKKSSFLKFNLGLFAIFF